MQAPVLNAPAAIPSLSQMPQSHVTVRPAAQSRSAVTRSAMTTESGRVRATSSRMWPVESASRFAWAAYNDETMACSISAPEKPLLAAASRSRSKSFSGWSRLLR
jgi:hypothetical protein